MARTRAERRHQMRRMKLKRRHDNANGDGSPEHLGRHYNVQLFLLAVWAPASLAWSRYAGATGTRKKHVRRTDEVTIHNQEP
ncbi:hypothetical protein [Enterobacter kobei]|uniref:hypothetical protein n=1 Tax=Enterobacter kobei TaxID=208224 RepID=UPI003CF49FDD